MSYRALKEKVASLKSPVFLDDRKEYPYLTFLKKDFPQVEFLLTKPDLLIVTNKIPKISFSKYRFIQVVSLSELSLPDYNARLNQETPILFEQESKMTNYFISLGFKPFQRTGDGEADIVLNGQGWFLPQYPEPISAKPFRKSLPIPPRKDYLNQQLLINDLSNFLIPDLADLTLDYLPVKEKLVRQWRLPKGSRNTFLRDFAISQQGEIYVLAGIDEDGKLSSHIQVLSPEGKLQREWEVANPFADLFALSPDGQVVYAVDSEHGTVAVMTREGDPIREWIMLRDESVTIDKIKVGPNGNIYSIVGDDEESEPRILVHSPKGKLIQTISFPTYDILYDIAFFGNEIFVSGPEDKCIYVLSQAGSPIGKIEMPKEPLPGIVFGPSAIAISSEGEIYALSQQLGGRLYVFNIDGVFLRESKILFRVFGSIAIGPRDEIYLIDELEEDEYNIRVFKKGY
jgi:sugar lactone lactonase YvrE